MHKYSLAAFLEKTAQQDRGQGVFELETDRLLELNLNGMVWIKMGAMIAYRGQVKFTREGILERGIGNLLKKAISGEGTMLTKAEGQGKVYLADIGKKVTILQLGGDALCVNGNDILAFEPSLQYNIRMLRKVTAMLAGGLFNVRLEGAGTLAITTHYDPVTLTVTPDNPVITDPNATVAWSGNLEPEFKKDISLKTFVGRGSGESIQMLFKGSGFVVVQPFEESYMQSASS